MRKLYFLLVLSLCFIHTKAQDSVAFTPSVSSNGFVNFINTTVLHGDGTRKAFWIFGDGTMQMTAPLAGTQHQYNGASVFTACLKIYKYFPNNNNDSVLTGQACRTITLQNTTADSCRAAFSDSIGSTPLSKTFKAYPFHNHNKRPEQVCWNFGDNHDTCISYNPAQSSDYFVAHNYSQAGPYQVCVKIRYQGGCESTYCRTIQVATGDSCRADFNMEPVASSPLSRYFVALPWQVQQKKPLRICWQFGDGHDTCIQYTTAATGPYAVHHNYASYGNYNVCVKILYDGGCEAQRCKPVSITPPPTDSCTVQVFEVATNLNNLERHFYVGINSNKVAEKICWNFGDGTDTCILIQNPPNTSSLAIVHHYPAPGVYHLCVKLWYAGGCLAQKCIEVVVRSATNLCGGYMTDSLTAIRSVLFKGFSVMNANDHVTSWQWTFGDGTGAGTQQASHTYANGGNYEVCLNIRTDLGCVTRICKHIIIQGNNVPQLQLSPNPVISQLHAVFHSALQEQVTISIYNANGIMVRNYTRSAVAGSNAWDFDVSTLPAGIYSMIVRSPTQLANAIFFKQ